MTGTVIKNTGSSYWVQLPNGSTVECKIKGNFRLKGIRTTNPIAIGDIVDILPNGDQIPYITKIHTRKNYIIRRSSNLSKEAHILASNIAQALLVVTIEHPKTNTTFIDRFLATAEAYNIPAILLFNKIDLYNSEEMEYLNAVINLYQSIGYECHKISAQTEEGLDKVVEILKDKTSLFSGNSGVGKTTLINKLIPGINLREGLISDTHNTGMHTTTYSQMFALPKGGYIIDTPGIKGFGTIDFKEQEVSHYFPEIFKISENCRFSNCTHRTEPGCAVKQALEDNYISQSRYASYLSILEDLAEGKYRTAY